MSHEAITRHEDSPDLKEYYIDFEGYCSIKAKSSKDAKYRFWNGMRSPSDEAYDEVYEIAGCDPDEAESAPDGQCFDDWRESLLDTELECMAESNFPNEFDRYYPMLNLFNQSCLKLPLGNTRWKNLRARQAVLTYIGIYKTI